MVRVTTDGVEPTSLTEYVVSLGGAFRSALGEDLDLSPETPQGQLIGVLALTLTEVDQALVAVSNGFSRSRALGLQLDDLTSLLGISRLLETKSSVPVTLTGVAGTTIPKGARAQTDFGDVFALTSETVIPAGGSVDATMEAEGPGPVPADPDSLTQILDLVAGWQAITNADSATLGRMTETDTEFRYRFGQLTARNARGSVEAILTAVLEVESVSDAVIRENDTSAAVTVQGKTVGAHSICVVAQGGVDAEVAATIARSKPLGTGTSGDTMVNIAHPGGWTLPIRFSRVNAIPIKVKMELALSPAFPADGTSQMILKVLEHVEGLAIGEPLTYQRLLGDMLNTPGHTVNLGVGRKSGTVVTGTGTVASLTTFHGRATVVTGTGTVASLTTLQGITNGTVTFLGQTVTGLDFSGDSDLDGVASTLQTALRATNASGLTNVEVAYDSAASAFVVTIPLDSNGAATSVSAAFTGSESDELGLDTATIVDGVDAITSGTVTFLSETVTGLDFSNVSSYDDVASVLQTGLRGTSETSLDEVEVTYVDDKFIITVPLDDDGNPVTVTGALTGDTADDLGMDTVETVQGSVTSEDDLELNERLTITSNDVTITIS